MRTGGDLVIETLSALGATTVFGIPGPCPGAFRCPGSQPVAVHLIPVENNAAFAADGFARVTNQPGVLIVSTGPGH